MIEIGEPMHAFDYDVLAKRAGGKVKIITAVPSLDTPVCDAETHRFNEEAGKLPEKAVILTISMDLPFAQKRWCAAGGIEQVKTYSDHREASFAQAAVVRSARVPAVRSSLMTRPSRNRMIR